MNKLDLLNDVYKGNSKYIFIGEEKVIVKALMPEILF